MEILVPSLLRIKPDALHKLGKYLRNENFNNIAIFFGEGIKELLFQPIKISFASSEIKIVHEEIVGTNDSDTIFQSAKKVPKKAQAIVAIGGGKTIDYCKYLGHINKTPIISVPTIVSNDGFCSPVASLLIDGARKTVQTQIPYGVILDTAILKNSPPIFLYSGIGDLLCKLTSIFDWKLSYRRTGEYVNDFAAVITQNAVNTFLHYNNKDLNDIQYITIIASSLLMNGIAMEIAKSSRPASGSEHIISHAYDQVAKKSSLHGLQVGVASYGVSSIQKKPHAAIKQMILDSGFFKFMTQHPLDKEDFIKAIRLAPEIKEDFHTILSEKNSIEKLIKFVNEDELMRQMVV